MCIAEVERFAADLQSNATLRAEAEKAQAEKSHANGIDRALVFAASKGYAFTAEEMKKHAKGRATAAGRELTDADLDGIAGGIFDRGDGKCGGDKKREGKCGEGKCGTRN